MKTTRYFCRWWLGAGLLLAGALNSLAVSAASAVSPVQGLQRQTGLFELYRDPDKGRLLLGIPAFDQPFLLTTSLPYGLGSNDIGLDRGQPGEVRLVEFRRSGNKVLLVQRNTRFVANSADKLERDSVTEAFAESVLWGGPVLAEAVAGKHNTLIDFTSYVVADRHGISQRLTATKQGSYKVDEARSTPVYERSKSFPDNTELEALLTFAGGGEGNFVRDVAVDPESLSLRQRVSLVRLPPEGFLPRLYHPASGGIDIGFYDFAQPLSASLDVRYQARFRLEKTDPGAAISPVKKPIVFYLDAGTPEPVRSALLDGARWWRDAFEAAGFKDAYRVELMPTDMDPMDARYSTIQWVHRATRGWSYGYFLHDPRTGEILKGDVTLGSQRVRQDILIAEGLLAPYGKSNEAELKAMAEQMALARLRQLSAHEVGHTLGFAHNFAASRHGNGSVMDYPHPMLSLQNGKLDLSQAYGVGIGPWDVFVVKHAYGQFPAASEATELATLREQIAATGMQYMSDPDSRSGDMAHPDGLLWDYGADSLDTFDEVMTVRRQALQRFSAGVLPPERQTGELAARLVPIYLLHRYQADAVARQLGGAAYDYATNSVLGNRAGTTPVSAAKQLAALERMVSLLSAETLALPGNVLDLMTPPAAGYSQNREYFASKMAPLFDAFAAVESAATLASQLLFDGARLNRLAWQQARDPSLPGVQTLMRAVFAGSWQRERFPTDVVAAETVQQAANWIVLDSVLAVLEGDQLHPSVAASVRSELSLWQRWLAAHAGRGMLGDNRRQAAAYLEQYLRDPAGTKRRPLPVIPPGAPI
ncbi:MAG: zinc-dependent metalloprotease [Pseudomonadota bacterium]